MGIFDDADTVDLWGAQLKHALWGKFSMTAVCQRCGGREPLSARELCLRFDENLSIVELRRELRCPSCTARGFKHSVEIERLHHPGVRAPTVTKPGQRLHPHHLVKPPSLASLMNSAPRWFWVACLEPHCGHARAVALAPIAIRWGLNASSERLRRSARCEMCGARGAELRHPSYLDSQRDWQPFPDIDQDAAMCGRYRLKRPWREIHDLYEITNDSNRVTPRWNVAPSQDVPVFRRAESGLEMSMLRWGLIPGWAKDTKIGYSGINARSESVAEKPMFRSAFKSRRCLIPADGYYEWQAVGKEKLPWLFTIGDDELFTFAGLWESWKDPASGETIETTAMLTTEPNEVARQIHDRMPVILPRAAYDTWLDPVTPADALKALLVPCPPDGMKFRRVTKRLNVAKANEGSQLNDPPDEQPAALV